ncbi:MAG: hypothetical protein EA400_05230 [Chromatiaceae bacterium]|nr:MAG: hypothetical protein EA400_05230 [Chromatiaceae bacterium]
MLPGPLGVPMTAPGGNDPDEKQRQVTASRANSPRPDQARRRARDPSAWAKEIYAAPPGQRETAGADARVTVSTRLRKPRVHLTAPATVPQLDLARFMGRWYEIARLPYFTQRRCARSIYADYVLGGDGLVYVTNCCVRHDGSHGVAQGIARVTDPPANTRLEISFRMLYGVHVFWDDFWVIGLGEAYDYALIGQATRRRGWVLAREPCPPEPAITGWLAEFTAKGFPGEAFVRTAQQGG